MCPVLISFDHCNKIVRQIFVLILQMKKKKGKDQKVKEG